MPEARPAQRGIPDSLLVGLLAFLLGLAVLTWTSTGLSALFARGAWPDTVTFGRTPEAIHALIQQPHDVPAAWPDTDPAALSGWGLFWGLFISQLLVLFVLVVFGIGVVARTKARRARARAERAEAAAAAAAAAAAGKGTATTATADRTAAPAATAAGGAEPGTVRADGTAAQAAQEQAAVPVTDDRTTGSRMTAGPSGPGASGTTTADTAPGSGPAVPEPRDSAAGTYPAPMAASAPATETAPLTAVPDGRHGGPDPVTAGGPSSVVPATDGRVGTPPGEARHRHSAAPAGPAAPRPASADAYSYGFGYAPARPAPPAAERATARLLYAGPADRQAMAAARIAEAEGPALVITSSPALWAETKDGRAKLGPVHLYDPSHLCDTPARLHWNPADECTDRSTAAARAIALLAPVRPQARMDAAVADTAETLLRSWLHAASLAGHPFKQVHRWAQGNGAHEAVRILRTHPKATPGAAGELESALTAHPERRDVAQQLTARALSALNSVHIRESCASNRTDALALASFLAEGGTLYLVGEPLEDPRTHPGAMPLLTALASSVVEHGRRMAARSSHGRLDPPLSLVLDDVAAVAPLPELPSLLTDPALPLLATCRSRAQALSRWPAASAALPSR
ncbi:type VI secretion protein [Streptomyces sp. NPDC048603]|uniref:type VI secretion protein n=1 Tax=Streptomyces sp. NPDC048603 TaxID=3365577 RepID=UPI003713482E